MLVVHFREKKKELKSLYRQKIQKNTDFIYRNELQRAWFQHGIVYCKSKVLVKKTSIKTLRKKTFKIVRDSKYDSYQGGLGSMVNTFFDKKSSGSSVKPKFQLAINFIGRSPERSREKKFIHCLETIFGVLIQLICNQWTNITKESRIYCVQLIFLVNLHGLFL